MPLVVPLCHQDCVVLSACYTMLHLPHTVHIPCTGAKAPGPIKAQAGLFKLDFNAGPVPNPSGDNRPVVFTLGHASCSHVYNLLPKAGKDLQDCVQRLQIKGSNVVQKRFEPTVCFLSSIIVFASCHFSSLVLCSHVLGKEVRIACPPGGHAMVDMEIRHSIKSLLQD